MGNLSAVLQELKKERERVQEEAQRYRRRTSSPWKAWLQWFDTAAYLI
jgi:hypothetical protein